MPRRWTSRSALLATAAFLGLMLASAPALTDGSPNPPTPSQAPSGGGASAGGSGGAAAAPAKKGKKATKKKTRKQKRSDQQFLDGYRVAYNLVQTGEYAQALAAFHALEQDGHPDVANYIGFLNRKLGNYELAKVWYERALAADPSHVRTWQYYGMWHVEQGNMLKAQDHLDTIRKLCGGEACKEFADLKGAMEGTVVY